MEKILIPNGCIAEVAQYKESVILDYKDNPFIEALPSLLKTNEIIEKLAFYPEYSQEERKLDGHYRIHLVNRLFQVFQPTPMCIELESKISRSIRQGYIGRNFNENSVVNGYIQDYKKINNLSYEKYNNLNQTASGFSLIGISGLGKTTSLNRILNMYPKVISHSEYKGMMFSNYQIPFIKVECPFDASIKGLLFHFLGEVDKLIGTNYQQKIIKSRPTTDMLIAITNQTIRSINLGMLIIDEIQCLSVMRTSSEKMMNLLINFINLTNIPILLVGTPSAIGILGSSFRQARRSTGQGGDMICDRIIRKDKVWDLLVNAVWDYQFTKKESHLTEELKDILYDETQGIPDLLKKIYAVSQVYAITTGKEEITPNIIRKVAKENLKLIQPMISALKSGNLREIAKYDDISIIDNEIDNFISKSKQSIDLDVRARGVNKRKEKPDKNEMLNIKSEAVLKLSALGIDVKKAQQTVDNIINNVDKIQDGVDINNVVIKAISIITNPENNKVEKSNKRVNLDPEDIRVIVEDAKKENKSVYESLVQSGHIKKFQDDIFNERW